MASTTAIRLRRSAAQLHALTQVEREIRATDPHIRRKYLRDFHEAFRAYESALTPAQYEQAVREADIVLVADYHALPQCQRFTAELVEQLAKQRSVVLAVEMIFARDQHFLDGWSRGEITSDALRQRTCFDLDWGYDWQPFVEMLERARASGVRVCGLDCMPRGDLRRIGIRDRHAALRIAEIRERHPDAAVVVLFGESHMAPNHLPRHIRVHRSMDRILTVLQNADQLYWQASGERDPVHAVRVNEQVVCVFNATPLEKYESYRAYIEKWRQERPAYPDFAPSFYNMVDALAQFLNLDRCSAAGAGPRFPVDMGPEVCSRTTDDQLRRAVLGRGGTVAEQKQVVAATLARGACYVPRFNTVFIRGFQITGAAEEAARFVHHACRGTIARDVQGVQENVQNSFYRAVLEDAVADFGARTLCPTRPPVRESDICSLYSLGRESVSALGIGSYREYMQTIDFLVLHKDYEASALHYRQTPALLAQAPHWEGKRREYAIRMLGAMLGTELYDSYVNGTISKRFIRSVFFRDLDRDARTAYFLFVRRVRRPKRILLT